MNKLFKSKKGQIAQLGGLAVGVAVLVITLTVAFLVMSEGKNQIIEIDDMCSGANGYSFNTTDNRCWNTTNAGIANADQRVPANLSYGWNSTGTLQSATATIPGWVPLIIITVIGSILLGLVALFTRRGR